MKKKATKQKTRAVTLHCDFCADKPEKDEGRPALVHQISRKRMCLRCVTTAMRFFFVRSAIGAEKAL